MDCSKEERLNTSNFFLKKKQKKKEKPYLNCVHGRIKQSRKRSAPHIHISLYRQVLVPDFNLRNQNSHPTKSTKKLNKKSQNSRERERKGRERTKPIILNRKSRNSIERTKTTKYQSQQKITKWERAKPISPVPEPSKKHIIIIFNSLENTVHQLLFILCAEPGDIDLVTHNAAVIEDLAEHTLPEAVVRWQPLDRRPPELLLVLVAALPPAPREHVRRRLPHLPETPRSPAPPAPNCWHAPPAARRSSQIISGQRRRHSQSQSIRYVLEF